MTVKTVREITASVLKSGMVKASISAVMCVPSSPPRAPASGRPMMAKLDRKTHCRITPRLALRFTNSSTAASPSRNSASTAPSPYSTASQRISPRLPTS